MEIEPRPAQPPAQITDAEREAASELLQNACGSGRLTLEEFSDRVGAVWVAERREQLEAATAGIAAAPPVGATKTVSTVIGMLGDQRRIGRWRLPAKLRTFTMLGDVHLDLRSVVVADPVIEITSVAIMGDLQIDVPEGVEVELRGFEVMGDRELRLAPVPRRPGTPLIRVRAYALMGDVHVTSAPPGQDITSRSWWHR
jgi:hypothetical protein